MRMVGLSCAVPKSRVPISAAYPVFGASEIDRIVGNLGVKEHREGPPSQCASDLVIEAGNPLLDVLGWDRKAVDACIFVTQTPDHPIPASAHRVARELKLGNSAICFDINLGCSGFTHGAIVMNGLMKAGVVRRGLLVLGDLSTHRFREGIADCKNPAAIGNSILFGDACAAVAFDDEGDDQVRAMVHGSDGNGYEHIHIPGGGARKFFSPEFFEPVVDAKGDRRRAVDIVLNGPEVFSFTIRRVPPMLDEALKRANWTKDEVDSFVFHQANKFMMDFLRKKMGLPAEKVPISIDEFGNTSSASIPMTMLTRQRALLDRPTKWVMLGYGLGLSWSALAMETSQIVSLPLIEV